jgi:hypothetical protein
MPDISMCDSETCPLKTRGSGMRNGNRRKVGELTAKGLSAKEIGLVLNIRPGTVYFHRHKLRERNDRQATTDSRRFERAPG